MEVDMKLPEGSLKPERKYIEKLLLAVRAASVSTQTCLDAATSFLLQPFSCSSRWHEKQTRPHVLYESSSSAVKESMPLICS